MYEDNNKRELKVTRCRMNKGRSFENLKKIHFHPYNPTVAMTANDTPLNHGRKTCYKNSFKIKGKPRIMINSQEIKNKNSLINFISNKKKSNFLDFIRIPANTGKKNDKLDSCKNIEDPLYTCCVLNHWLSLEKEAIIIEKFLEKNEELNGKARSILVDWIVQVADNMSLQLGTLELTIQLIDRYTQVSDIKITKYQLVGISCLFIACKFEESQAPEVKRLLFLTENSFKFEEVIEMELKILCSLHFNISSPTSFHFIPPLLSIIAQTEKISSSYRIELQNLTNYLCCLCLLDNQIVSLETSIRCLAAFNLSKVFLSQDEKQEFELTILEDGSEIKIKYCIKLLCLLISTLPPNLNGCSRLFFNKDHKDVINSLITVHKLKTIIKTKS